MENLAKAVIAVMKEVTGMEKKAKIGSGKVSYDGTKDQDVKEVFNKALADNGLCILPTGIEEETQIDRWEGKDYNGNPAQKQSVFTKVKTKYLLLHISGESQELAGYGHGVDPQDKGAGKATTYALKNCLLLTFLTPVGKMPDTDTTHSQEIETPKNVTQITKPKDKPAKPNLTSEQYNQMIAVLAKGKYIEVETKMENFTLTLDQRDNLENAIEEAKKFSN